jgi:hypothetical protein
MLSQGVIPGEEDKRGLAYTLVRSDWSGRRSELIPWTFLDDAAPEPGGYRVSVQCRRGRIAVSVNGREVNRAEDDAIDSGLVGFGLFGTGRAVFRDLVVEELR